MRYFAVSWLCHIYYALLLNANIGCKLFHVFVTYDTLCRSTITPNPVLCVSCLLLLIAGREVSGIDSAGQLGGGRPQPGRGQPPESAGSAQQDFGGPDQQSAPLSSRTPRRHGSPRKSLTLDVFLPFDARTVYLRAVHCFQVEWCLDQVLSRTYRFSRILCCLTFTVRLQCLLQGFQHPDCLQQWCSSLHISPTEASAHSVRFWCMDWPEFNDSATSSLSACNEQQKELNKQMNNASCLVFR